MSMSVRRSVLKNKVSAQRLLSYASATEDFPLKVKVNPTPASKPEVSFKTLGNGAKVGVSTLATPIATIKVGVLGGSAAETAHEKGSAQLLSSNAFAGNDLKSGLRTVRDFENIGATIESSIDREKITYTVRVPNEHAQQALEWVLESINAPITKKWAIAEFKPKAEIFYKGRCPGTKLREYLHEAAYGEGTPLGSSIYADDLYDLEEDEVINYRNRVFVAQNVRVAVQSSLPADKVASIVEGKNLRSGSKVTIVSPFVGGETRVRSKIARTNAGIAFAAPAGDAGKPFHILNTLLDSKVATKLSHVQFHLHSTCHDAGSYATRTKTFLHPYSAGGIFGAIFKGDAKYIGDSINGYISTLKNVASGQVSSEEVNAAKNKARLESAIAGESLSGINNLYNSLVAGSSSPLVEVDFGAVSVDAVVGAAKASVKSTPAFSVYGSTLNVPSLLHVLKTLQ